MFDELYALQNADAQAQMKALQEASDERRDRRKLVKFVGPSSSLPFLELAKQLEEYTSEIRELRQVERGITPAKLEDVDNAVQLQRKLEDEIKELKMQVKRQERVSLMALEDAKRADASTVEQVTILKSDGP